MAKKVYGVPSEAGYYAYDLDDPQSSERLDHKDDLADVLYLYNEKEHEYPGRLAFVVVTPSQTDWTVSSWNEGKVVARFDDLGAAAEKAYELCTQEVAVNGDDWFYVGPPDVSG